MKNNLEGTFSHLKILKNKIFSKRKEITLFFKTRFPTFALA